MNNTELPTPLQNSDSKSVPKVKPEFVEPKVRFVEPQLVKRGSVGEVTATFFGTFYVNQPGG